MYALCVELTCIYDCVLTSGVREPRPVSKYKEVYSDAP